MGQWEKRTDAAIWEAGKESFPIELANRTLKEGLIRVFLKIASKIG